jgi:5-(carboxyamino)imidazole ribonucleotide synthase
MLVLAAAPLGLRCHVFCPDEESPAFDVAASRTIASYDDHDALDAFAGAVDVVTFEFENVPAATAERLAARVPVRPGAEALAITQDRLTEKTFLARQGLATAPFLPVSDRDDFREALLRLGPLAILKTRRLGYDGKGQEMLRGGEDPDVVLDRIGHAPAILEAMVRFSAEISVVGVRGVGGDVVLYDATENIHRDGILRLSTVPARIAAETAAEAGEAVRSVLTALDYVGALAIEFFVVGGGTNGAGESLIANEIAPRVHNSGHWTIDACAASQFENHIRAVAGWSLAPTARNADAAMENLIGDDVDAWRELAAEPDARLHLYGKREPRPGRKMGHVTRLKA